MNSQAYSCEACGSSDRDRLIAIFLDLLSKHRLPLRNIRGSHSLRILDIAPSGPLRQFLLSRFLCEYTSVDLHRQDVTLRVDVCCMPVFVDESFDMVICSHVLEHVRDDFAAMSEIRRVLSKDGLAVLLVPLIKGVDLTDEVEKGVELDASESWKRFGQGDHVRLYGRKDFIDRLVRSGFEVSIFYASEYLTTREMNFYGISHTSALYVAVPSNKFLL